MLARAYSLTVTIVVEEEEKLKEEGEEALTEKFRQKARCTEFKNNGCMPFKLWPPIV
jgi:hypothetical protein